MHYATGARSSSHSPLAAVSGGSSSLPGTPPTPGASASHDSPRVAGNIDERLSPRWRDDGGVKAAPPTGSDRLGLPTIVEGADDESLLASAQTQAADISPMPPPTSRRTRILVDPVHGNITVEPFQYEVMNMPAFQRLARILQNGPVKHVYPSTTHTRLSHCMGVGHVAKRMYDHIVTTQPEVRARMHPMDRQLVVTAAMCHDLGHAPFSHTFETYIQEYVVSPPPPPASLLSSSSSSPSSTRNSNPSTPGGGCTNTLAVSHLLVDNGAVPASGAGAADNDAAGLSLSQSALTPSGAVAAAAAFHHEEMSIQLLEYACEQGQLPFLDAPGDPQDTATDDDALLTSPLARRRRRLQVIASLISGELVGDCLPPHKRWILDLVSNPVIDADRMDYLQRDSQTVFGTFRSTVNPERILYSMRVVDGRVCYHRNVAFNLYQMLRWRFEMHRTVYTHHSVLSAELMICDVLRLAHNVLRFDDYLCPERFISFDDGVLDVIRWKAREMPHSIELQQAKALLDRMDRRQFYVLVGECRLNARKYTRHEVERMLGLDRIRRRVLIAAREQGSEIAAAVPPASSLRLVIKATHYGTGHSNPIDAARIFYDDHDLDASISVLPSDISPVLPEVYGEYGVFVFAKERVVPEVCHLFRTAVTQLVSSGTAAATHDAVQK